MDRNLETRLKYETFNIAVEHFKEMQELANYYKGEPPILVQRLLNDARTAMINAKKPILDAKDGIYK